MQTRPLYQPTIETTVVSQPKARINLNSMGNTPVNSSTSSPAGSFGGGMIRNSDFLMPIPAYSRPLSNSPSSYTTSPILPPPEPFAHGSLHQLPAAYNIPSSNGHTTNFPSSKNNFQSSMVRIMT